MPSPYYTNDQSAMLSYTPWENDSTSSIPMIGSLLTYYPTKIPKREKYELKQDEIRVKVTKFHLTRDPSVCMQQAPIAIGMTFIVNKTKLKYSKNKGYSGEFWLDNPSSKIVLSLKEVFFDIIP